METLYIFFALQVIVWICYMLPVPILPEEALSRGISLDLVGVILAVYTITFLLSSFILGKMMALWGKVRFLNMALVILFLTTFLFGVVMLVREKNVFIVVTTLLRLMQGLACGGYAVIIYSMVPEYYPERIEEVFSYMELFTGLSTASAPLLGMFLFELIGAGLTFMAFSLVYLLLLVVLNRNMVFGKTDRDLAKKDMEETEEQHFSNLSTFELLKNRQYLVTFGIYTVNSTGFFVVNPILGERVKEITGAPTLIGVAFSVFCFCYAISGITLGQMFKKRKINKKMLFILSSLFLFSSYFLLGVTNDLENLMLALVLLGIGEALIIIPYIPEAIELGTNVYANEYGWVGDMASLFWNLGFAVGEFAGPIMGGSLTSAYGFGSCCLCYAFIVAGMLGLYLVFGSVLSRYTSLDEKLLSNYASFGGVNRKAKFYSNEIGAFRSRPIFMKSI